jgi:hypothetical protein
MDRFSFLNAAHTDFSHNYNDQYTENPDSVEAVGEVFFKVLILDKHPIMDKIQLLILQTLHQDSTKH